MLFYLTTFGGILTLVLVFSALGWFAYKGFTNPKSATNAFLKLQWIRVYIALAVLIIAVLAVIISQFFQ